MSALCTCLNDCSKYFMIMGIMFPYGFECIVDCAMCKCTLHSCISHTLSMSQPNTPLQCTFSIERLENCVQFPLYTHCICCYAVNKHTHKHSLCCLFTALRNSTRVLKAGLVPLFIFIHNYQMVFAMPKFNAHMRKKREQTA